MCSAAVVVAARAVPCLGCVGVVVGATTDGDSNLYNVALFPLMLH